MVSSTSRYSKYSTTSVGVFFAGPELIVTIILCQWLGTILTSNSMILTSERGLFVGLWKYWINPLFCLVLMEQSRISTLLGLCELLRMELIFIPCSILLERNSFEVVNGHLVAFLCDYRIVLKPWPSSSSSVSVNFTCSSL